MRKNIDPKDRSLPIPQKETPFFVKGMQVRVIATQDDLIDLGFDQSVTMKISGRSFTVHEVMRSQSDPTQQAVYIDGHSMVICVLGKHLEQIKN